MFKNNIKKIVSCALAITLAAGSIVFLSGCDAAREVVGTVGGDAGKSATNSRNTTVKDRQNCWGVVKDIANNEFSTVIYLQTVGNLKFDVDLAKKVLQSSNINWYQLIASDAMGTQKQEYGMVYFPASVTLTDMQTALNVLAGVYEAHIMTKVEYEQYLDQSPSDNIWDLKIYGKEITHYGPAAQQGQEG